MQLQQRSAIIYSCTIYAHYHIEWYYGVDDDCNPVKWRSSSRVRPEWPLFISRVRPEYKVSPECVSRKKYRIFDVARMLPSLFKLPWVDHKKWTLVHILKIFGYFLFILLFWCRYIHPFLRALSLVECTNFNYIFFLIIYNYTFFENIENIKNTCRYRYCVYYLFIYYGTASRIGSQLALIDDWP